MKPLRVAVLWHQHQPYYKKDAEFIMPWVRLHGIKDYVDVPAILEDYPDVRQTFNLVPSLMLQIEDYVNDRAIDSVQRLTLKDASTLTPMDKKEILQQFFLCHVDKMVMPYPQYRTLYERSRNPEEAFTGFSTDDWRDLQVWYNLTWLGPRSRKNAEVQALFTKGVRFSEADKTILMGVQKKILEEIIPTYRRLYDKGQIEISVSPKFHPILPLICDTWAAKESMPDTPLPDRFKFPQDAAYHIKDGIEIFKRLLEHEPQGMWPSEGSVSDEALSLMFQHGIRWAATDEQILQHTMGNDYHWLDRYFPHTVQTRLGPISMLFRDHNLSDAIGFVYSNWNPFDAAANFRERLLHIRNELIQQRGEDSLDTAVVPVILDGENCWEYYDQNGEPFLRHFFRELSENPALTTITCNEAIQTKHATFSRNFIHIYSGSWINHNFRIWIGHHEDNSAWNMLKAARDMVENQKRILPMETIQQALDALYIAEGSDWFWWYGDEHTSANQADFDLLFRWYVQQAYTICKQQIPDDLYKPIISSGKHHLIIPQRGPVKPHVDGKVSSEQEWENAGFYDAVMSGGAMHHATDIFKRIWFGRDQEMLYFRCDINRPLLENEQIELYFIAPKQVAIKQSRTSLTIQTYFASGVPTTFPNCSFAYDSVFELAVPQNFLFGTDKMGTTDNTLQIRIHVTSQTGTNIYPTQGSLELVFQ